MIKICPEFSQGIRICQYGYHQCGYKHITYGHINEDGFVLRKDKCRQYIKGFCIHGTKCTRYHDPIFASYFKFRTYQQSLKQNINYEEITGVAIQHEYDLPIFGRKQKVFYELSLPHELLPRGVSKIVLDYLLIPPEYYDISILESNYPGLKYDMDCSFCKLDAGSYNLDDVPLIVSLPNKKDKSVLIICWLCSEYLHDESKILAENGYKMDYHGEFDIYCSNIIVDRPDGKGGTSLQLIHKRIDIIPNNESGLFKFLGIENMIKTEMKC